jgi:hypothetical protein
MQTRSALLPLGSGRCVWFERPAKTAKLLLDPLAQVLDNTNGLRD